MSKRENSISVLLSDDEFDFIDNISHEKNISRAAMIRALIFKERKRIRDKVARVKHNIAEAGR